jgi:hypothetical protein
VRGAGQVGGGCAQHVGWSLTRLMPLAQAGTPAAVQDSTLAPPEQSCAGPHTCSTQTLKCCTLSRTWSAHNLYRLHTPPHLDHVWLHSHVCDRLGQVGCHPEVLPATQQCETHMHTHHTPRMVAAVQDVCWDSSTPALLTVLTASAARTQSACTNTLSPAQGRIVASADGCW